MLVAILVACSSAPASRVTRVASIATAAPATVPTTVPTVPTAPPTTAPPIATIVTATTIPSPTPALVEVQAVAFQIDPTQSQATFTLNEELLGAPTTVQGATSEVSGVISITQSDLGKTEIGTIRINARDLRTDEEMRNRAIRTFILQSEQDQFQFITFEPAKIVGLPTSVKLGEAATFKVAGSLKIRDIAKPVTFDVTVTAKSDSELEGDATATVKRSDFDLNIPNVPGVANVSDEVAVEFKFIAKKM